MNGESKAGLYATIFGVALIVLVAAVTVTAIMKYDSVDDALKIWNGMETLISVIVGGAATYFFSRQTTRQAIRAADRAEKHMEDLRAFAKTQGVNLP